MIRVLYFASLRDQAGCETEQVEAAGRTAEQLYAILRERHGFSWGRESLRVAIDGDFAAWDAVPADDAELCFITPVSGG